MTLKQFELSASEIGDGIIRFDGLTVVEVSNDPVQDLYHLLSDPSIGREYAQELHEQGLAKYVALVCSDASHSRFEYVFCEKAKLGQTVLGLQRGDSVSVTGRRIKMAKSGAWGLEASSVSTSRP